MLVHHTPSSTPSGTFADGPWRRSRTVILAGLVVAAVATAAMLVGHPPLAWVPAVITAIALGVHLAASAIDRRAHHERPLRRMPPASRSEAETTRRGAVTLGIFVTIGVALVAVAAVLAASVMEDPLLGLGALVFLMLLVFFGLPVWIAATQEEDEVVIHRLAGGDRLAPAPATTTPVRSIPTREQAREQAHEQGGVPMRLTTLTSLLVNELNDLLHAERQVALALPRYAAAASSDRLRDTITEHAAETKNHADRITVILASMGERPRRDPCRAMEGLIAEADALVERSTGAEPAVRDAAIIAALQRIEHYEIAGYGCARAFARTLGGDDAAAMLQETLDEEAADDEALTALAEDEVNRIALEQSHAR